MPDTKEQWVRHVREHLPPLGLGGPRELEIVEELAEHLEAAYEEELALGRTEPEARAHALAQFPDWRLLECELSRAEASALERWARGAASPAWETRPSEQRGGAMLEQLLKDLRYGFRMLRRKPGFTAVAVVTLALGIGANTAIFSVVNAVLLRALPYPEPERLVSVYESLPQGGTGSVSVPNLLDWRAQSDVFTGLAAYEFDDFNLQEEQQPVRAVGATVTANFFEVLGARPQAGRTFVEGEDRAGRDRVVVLSDRLWRRSYGASPDIVGRDILLGGEKYQVVGVMPPSTRFPSSVELWVPLAFSDAQLASRGSHSLLVLGRLRPGVSFGQAQEQMTTIGRIIEQQYPAQQEGRGVTLARVEEEAVQGVRPALLILLGAVGFVLLIACTNVANLLLARAAARRKEVAIRSALGAGRWRLMRQFLTESVLLALAGGAAGLLVARWTVRALSTLAASYIARSGGEVALDWRVLVFTAALSLLTGVVAGLAPALHVSRADVQETLKESGNAGSSARGTWLRSGLAVAEVASALVLLVGAGLLVKSFLRLQRVETGLRPENVLTMRISLPQARYDTAEKSALFYREVLERVSSLPGVEAAGVINLLPLQSYGNNGEIQVEGRPPQPPGRVPLTEFRRASAGYFKALGIPLLAGRLLEPADEAGSTLSVVVSRELVRTFFPDGDALGKRIQAGGGAWWTIVGVVGDVKQSGLTRPSRPELYFPFTAGRSDGMTLVVRAASDTSDLTAAVRREVQAVDANQPVYNVRTMEEVIDLSVASRKLNMTLLSIFAGLATLLAVVGIYSVMSYLVTQHTREIGIRVALGAQPGNILRLVVGQGLTLTLVGVAVGAVAAFGLTRLMSSLLYEVEGSDPATYVSVSALLVLVALAACYVPARRATKVDPLVALRYE